MPPKPEFSSSFSVASALRKLSAFPKTARGTQYPPVLQQLLRLLLPPTCQLCGEALSSHSSTPDLCPVCTKELIYQPPATCPICSEPYVAPMVAIHPCSQCVQHPPAFIWLKTMGIHTEKLQNAVHQLKYAGHFHLAQPLTQLLLQRLYPEIMDFAPHTIIPVPLHPRRLRERGFNQSLLVARHLGAALQIPVNSRYLMRKRATHAQTNLTRLQRQQNLKGAFDLYGSLTPRRILLVDDVVTTTSTCRECATILNNAGHDIAVVALSRARLYS